MHLGDVQGCLNERGQFPGAASEIDPALKNSGFDSGDEVLTGRLPFGTEFFILIRIPDIILVRHGRFRTISGVKN